MRQPRSRHIELPEAARSCGVTVKTRIDQSLDWIRLRRGSAHYLGDSNPIKTQFVVVRAEVCIACIPKYLDSFSCFDILRGTSRRTDKRTNTSYLLSYLACVQCARNKKIGEFGECVLNVDCRKRAYFMWVFYVYFILDFIYCVVLAVLAY